MRRTAEKVLGIISIVLNAIGIFALIFVISMGSLLTSDSDILSELEQELYEDPTMTDEEIEEVMGASEIFLDFVIGFSWLILVLTIVAIILSIIAVIQIDKKAKNAGIMFLIASFLSGLIISIQGILLLIAGIMALVRKPPIQPEPTQTTVYSPDNTNNTL